MDSSITAIRVQSKNPKRVNVFLDGEYAFSLEKILAARLSLGQILTAEKIEKLKDQDNEEKAYLRALHFLSYRPRSINEVQERLTKAGFSENAIQIALQRLINAELLGDHEFSRLWIENRTLSSPRSKRALEYELRKKGVDREIIQNALSRLDDETPLAKAAAEKYSRRLRTLPFDLFRRKLSGFLARRGFNYGIITEIIPVIWKEMNEK